jgi:uncharacterized protein
MHKFIADTLNLPAHLVKNVLQLFESGATIPFIARYRKEATGNMDEQSIESIQKEFKKQTELEKRKKFVLASIAEQGKLTDSLKFSIEKCTDLQSLEDLYLPFKTKRKTKAEAARLLGLQALADKILEQKENNIQAFAKTFLSKEVPTVKDALEGARHILAEYMNEQIPARNIIRKLFKEQAVLKSSVKKKIDEKAQTYADYFDYTGKLADAPSHRILAIYRGENEGYLKINIEIEEEKALKALKAHFLKAYNDCSYQMGLAVEDAFKRLLSPSISNEFKTWAKEKADKEAIQVFSENLRQLLLEAPLGQKRILGIDPGFRTGCKLAIISEQGNFTEHQTIYPNAPQLQQVEGKKIIQQLLQKYKIEAVAIGNGTAGRETEYFMKDCVHGTNIDVFLISEAGASIYSASELARKEFPQLDLTVRGAISIARRLQDPLAELVKIDAKSIGVGQYQHDVDQEDLRSSLENTVISAVNKVGIQLNTASQHVLQFVSGVGPKLAENIVAHRTEHGPFSSRLELKKVKGLGEKAFEQSAGFLRIAQAKNILDNTGVHPERYELVNRMAKKQGCNLAEFISNESARKNVSLNEFMDESTGLASFEGHFEGVRQAGFRPKGQGANLSVCQYSEHARHSRRHDFAGHH